MKNFLALCLAFVVSATCVAMSPVQDDDGAPTVLVIGNGHIGYAAALPAEYFLASGKPFDFPVLIVVNEYGSAEAAIQAVGSDPGSSKCKPIPGSLEALIDSIIEIDQRRIERLRNQFDLTAYTDADLIEYELTVWQYEGQLIQEKIAFQSYEGDAYRGERAYLNKV